MPRNAGGCAVFFGKYSGKHIYSLEELAWCMDQHAELTGIDIYKESFAGWVKEELGLADEGQTLFDLLAREKGYGRVYGYGFKNGVVSG